MSILIKGMEMPKMCGICMCYNADDDGPYCFLSSDIKGVSFYAKPKTCPLVPVPEHGRLIDADALTDALEETDWYHQNQNKDMVHGANSLEHQAWYKEQEVYAAVDGAPTVIPASKEGGE